MQRTRYHASVRRRSRRVVTITASAVHAGQFTPSHAAGYATGLHAAEYLRDLFPKVYQEHVAPHRVTPGSLRGVAEALLHLVDRHLFPIEWTMELWQPVKEPVQLLYAYADHDPFALDMLEEHAWFLSGPRPRFYGVGVATMLECLDNFDEQDVLLFALWHICYATSWGLGVDITDIMRNVQLDAALIDCVLALPRLPPDTDMAVLRALLDAQQAEPPLGTLVAYAHAATENGLADHSYEDIGYLHNGQIDLSWDDAFDLALEAREAQMWQDGWSAWRDAVATAPFVELPRIATLLLVAAGDAQPTSKALMHIVAQQENGE